MAWITLPLGALLLLLLGVDVFQTAFHGRGQGGPLNRHQNRLVWKTVRALGTRGDTLRPGLLSLGGPILAVITIFGWSLLLLGGFWLIYLPFIDDFHVEPGRAGSAALEAFYYSGIVAATLGHGDVVAPEGWLRVLTVFQAVLGFALVTVAVTYVLAVYRELVSAQTLAIMIDARLQGEEHEDGNEGFSGSLMPDAADWDRDTANQLARVLESHHNFPILHWFRPARRARALPYQVTRLYMVMRGLERNGHEHAGTAAHRALLTVIGRYVDDVHALFVPGSLDSGHDDLDPDETRLRKLARILDLMAYPRPEERRSETSNG